MLAGLFVLLVGIIIYLWQHATEKRETVFPDKHRVAVLPLANISPDTKDEYFAEGMTEELISTLSKIGGLRVIARTSIMQYKGGNKEIAEIGRELKVGTILEGSVRKTANKLRITVQLIDVQTQEHLWSQDYDRELEDVFAIQSDIAQRVAEALRMQLLAGEIRQIEKKATENLEAYTSYLKGRFYWNKRTPEGMEKGVAYFEQAIANDPNYAPGYAGLADCYALLGSGEYGVLLPKLAMPKAKAHALKALAIDNTLAEAHAALANVTMVYDWNWLAAEKEFTRAIELNPSYATAHHWYALCLATSGRLEEATAEMKKAQELDPLSLVINLDVGLHFYFARQYDQAIAQYRKTLEMDPNFVLAHLTLGLAYVQKARFEEAIAEFQQAMTLSGESAVVAALLGYAHAASGQKDNARRILDELTERSQQGYIPSYLMALIYTGLGEKENAFEWLEKAYEERSNLLIYLKADPILDSLRSDPRFTTLLKTVGFAEREAKGEKRGVKLHPSPLAFLLSPLD
jgi:TolB-like protein/Tfp pilus assembly protein PilF